MAKKVTGERFGERFSLDFRFCSRCGEELEWESKDYYCKECRQRATNKWRKENPDKYKESNRKSVKKWAEKHPNYYNTQYIYIIWGRIDGMVTPLYIGSTKRPWRTNEHLSGGNGTSAEQWVKFGVHKVEYADVTELVENRAEREWIEDWYIEEFEPTLNRKVNNPAIPEERMEELSELVYNGMVEFRELEIIPEIKETSFGEEISFNNDDLVFEY